MWDSKSIYRYNNTLIFQYKKNSLNLQHFRETREHFVETELKVRELF